MDRYQCEYCGEIPIQETCPHGCHERTPKAWKNGRYTYCLSHGRSQVISWEYVYKGDVSLWNGRKCDWCGGKL